MVTQNRKQCTPTSKVPATEEKPNMPPLWSPRIPSSSPDSEAGAVPPGSHELGALGFRAPWAQRRRVLRNRGKPGLDGICRQGSYGFRMKTGARVWDVRRVVLHLGCYVGSMASVQQPVARTGGCSVALIGFGCGSSRLCFCRVDIIGGCSASVG